LCGALLLQPSKKISTEDNGYHINKNSFNLNFTQIAWVVEDIAVAVKFFKDTMDISNFGKTVTIRAQDFQATYYEVPSDAESLVSMAYSGATFIELIQPVSGRSIFQDYLDKNPAGGVQHIAYNVAVADFDKVISDLTGKGYPVIATYDTQ